MKCARLGIMNIKEIQSVKERFDKARGWDKFDASNVFVHLVEELGEIGRHVNIEEGYKKNKGHINKPERSDLEREFAQTLMLFLQLANHYGIDLESAFSNELKIMEKRFGRDSVRKNLSSLKSIQIRNVSRPAATKEIFNYMKTHREAYASDISEELELDLDLVFSIMKELNSKGIVE